ncbi:MAG: hypothetical protein ABIQ18_17100, partial [Umezawaea sp.]
QDYVIHTGPFGLVEAVLGIMAFGGLLSALLGSAAVKAAAIVAVVIGVLGLYFLLVANKIEWRHKTDGERAVLRRQCDNLESRGQKWRVLRWAHEIIVQANGDVRETIEVSAVVECDVLDFVSVVAGPHWDWPDRLKPRVRLNVRSVQGRTRYDYTYDWIARNRLKVLVHLTEPASRDDVVSFVVELQWPAKCAPLMRGHRQEDFVLIFDKPVEEVKYVVVLPPGFGVFHDRLGLTADDSTLTSEPTRSGQVETMLTVLDAPANKQFGMRLDLRSGAQP